MRFEPCCKRPFATFVKKHKGRADLFRKTVLAKSKTQQNKTLDSRLRGNDDFFSVSQAFSGSDRNGVAQNFTMT